MWRTIALYAYYENRSVPFQCGINLNFHFPLHLHNQAELVYIIDGQMHVTIDGQTRLLGAGEAALCFPNCAHSYQTPEASRALIAIFDVNLAGDFSLLFQQKRPLSPFLAADQVHPDFLYIYPSLCQPQPARLLKGYMQVILSHFFDRLTLVEEKYNPSTDLTHQALLFVMQHFLEPLSLESVSRQLGVSKYHLSRIFSKRVCTSFNEYVNILRVNHAQQLLASPGKSVLDVGFEAGFESSSSFFRVFKNLCGVTPNQYRRRLLEAEAPASDPSPAS